MKSLRIYLLVFLAANGQLLRAQDTDELRYLSRVRQLIFEGNRSGEGYFSEDGRHLVFQAEREEDNPFYQIYILDFKTGDIRRVSPGTGKTTCAYFEGSGYRLLFASSHKDPDVLRKQREEMDIRASGRERKYSWDYEPWMDIFISERDGSGLVQLTDSYGYDAEGSWSPDGQWIVFSSNRKAYEDTLTESEKQQLEMDPSWFCDLYIVHPDGSGLKQLTDTPGYDGGPFFSPDGRRIVWRRFSTDGHMADLYTMNIDGSNERRLTDFGCLSWTPFYHPSGEYIIFAANKEGHSNFELYLVINEGFREPVRVTWTDGFDGLPVFSPDGERLVWTSSRTSGGEAQLFIAGWDHEAARETLERSPLRNTSILEEPHSSSYEITEYDLRYNLEYLASDELNGRMTGSDGSRVASEFIAGLFRSLEMEPLPGQNDFFWPFEFVADYALTPSGNSLVFDDEPYQLNRDFAPLGSSASGEVSGNLIFAGYGIKVSNGQYSYNSYDSLKIRDQVVMVLDGIPPGMDEEQRKNTELTLASGYKQMLARQMGARAILIVTPATIDPGDREVPGNSGILSLYLSEEAATRMLKSCGRDLENIRQSLTGGNISRPDNHFDSGQEIEIRIEIDYVPGSDRNVIGVLSSQNPDAEYILLGAHFDHLGRGEVNSRAKGEHRHLVHNGADDNASGVSAVMEMAGHFRGISEREPERLKHHLVFCLWSGEELGMIGSSSFALNLPIPADRIRAYLNFDMVGRMQDNRLYLQGLGSGAQWKQAIEKTNILSGFDLVLGHDPYLPTDATSLYIQGIPIISFFTGIHDDYHTDTDDAHLINYPDLKRVVDFACMLTGELMKPGQEMTYQEVRARSNRMSRGARSVSLGTIPAYVGGDEKGVRIQGVRPGGPADKAGLKGDDLITGLNGKDVFNIYDFMNILNELEAGRETTVRVFRNGGEMLLRIIPEARE
ncbi:MAG: M28 family peptidase [Bacteroidales bacterium]|nr:M28 family peptidase [Bacteroidales bacterium]